MQLSFRANRTPNFDPQFKAIAEAALNEAAEGLRSYAATEVSSKYNITPENVRKHIDIWPATQQILSARVKFRRRKIPLIEFSHSVTAQGVRVSIERGKSKLLRGAFIQRGSKSGQQHIFRRISKGGKLVPRYPITKQKFAGVSAIIAGTELRQKLQDHLDRILPAAFQRRMTNRPSA